jgi:hypothetical protein
MPGQSLGGSTPQATPWLPGDNQLLVANGDPDDAVNTSLLTAGTVYLTKLTPRSPLLLSNLWFGLATVGVGASTGSFAGVYSAAGILLATSADIDTQLTGTTGGISIPLSAPQLIASSVWAAIVANLATTQPTLSRGQGGSLPNLNLTPATFRFGIAATGQTSLPSSINPAAISGSGGVNLWAGGN